MNMNKMNEELEMVMVEELGKEMKIMNFPAEDELASDTEPLAMLDGYGKVRFLGGYSEPEDFPKDIESNWEEVGLYNWEILGIDADFKYPEIKESFVLIAIQENKGFVDADGNVCEELNRMYKEHLREEMRMRKIIFKNEEEMKDCVPVAIVEKGQDKILFVEDYTIDEDEQGNEVNVYHFMGDVEIPQTYEELCKDYDCIAVLSDDNEFINGEGYECSEIKEIYRSESWKSAGSMMKAMREHHNITLSEASIKIGVSSSTLSKFEKGQGVRAAKIIENGYKMMCEIDRLKR